MSTVRCESVSLFTLTPGGQKLASQLRGHLPMKCYCAEKYLANSKFSQGFEAFAGSFKNSVAQAFMRDSAIIVIGACGIVVRTIAPLLADKLSDPAVLVIDEKGNNVISLLSGHLGGANELTRYVSNILEANAVITTSTDVNQTCSLDLLSRQMCAELVDFRRATKTVNQLLVSGEPVGIYVDPDLSELLGFDIHNFDIRGLRVVAADEPIANDLSALIDVSMNGERPDWPVPSFQLIPKRIVAGVGCRKALAPNVLLSLFEQHLARHHLHPLAVASLGSIDIKQDEPALLELAKLCQVPLTLYSAEQLVQSAERFPSSEFVKKTVGVGSVSQPVAWLLSGGQLLGETLKTQGVTISLGVLN